MTTPMNGHGKLMDVAGPSVHQSENTRGDSRDGIMAQRNRGENVILLVEDNRGDVVLLKRAFSMAGLPHDFLVAGNGLEAIEYFSEGDDSEARLPVPTHVLLDLNLPGRNGLEVLAWIRAHSNWRKLPVIVLSDASLECDISQAEQFGIDAYLPKGFELADTKAAVARIAAIWNLLPMSPRQELASQ